jgi:hypothetical protein
MYDVEITYRTRIGNLVTVISSHAVMATRADADELREMLRTEPGLEQAVVKIKSAEPWPTVDEALDRIRANLLEYPPVKGLSNAKA